MKASKAIFYSIYLFTILFFFSSCTSQKKYIHSKKQELQIPYAIILYASDSPDKLPYFSTFFTERLNKENIFNAIHSHEINKLWIENVTQSKKIKDIEGKIREIKNNVKIYVKKDKNINFRKPNFKDEVYNLIADHPCEISSHILGEFFFWNTLAEIKDKQDPKNSFLFYKKYTSVAEKNLYKSEIDGEYLHKFQDLDSQLSPSILRIKNIPIYSDKKCLLFVNGVRVKENYVILPIYLKSVFSASCPEGNFSKIFIPERIQLISINKYNAPLSTNVMPNNESLPKDLILKQNPKYIILIYWSNKSKLVEAKVVEPKNLITIKRTSFELNSENDYKILGDNLIQFLKMSTFN